MKRFLAMLLCAVMVLTMAAVPSKAVVVDLPDSGKVVTVLAGSDFQYSNSDHGIAGGHLESILDAIQADGATSIDGFLFAGDYSQAFTEAASKEGSAYLKNLIATRLPELAEDRKVLIQGNHDPDSLTVDGTLATSGAHDTQHYGVFAVNEKDYMWYTDMNEATVKTTAARLRNYLTAKCRAGYTKPIFIVSHVQLHYSMRTNIHGDGMYANYLFDVINEAGANGLNIFFLFGHNHSNGWDDYLGGSAVFLTRGDKMPVAQGSQTEFREETLNFTYLNAGYVGYYTQVNTGAESDLTMTTFQITEDEVTVSRYNANGVHDVKSVGVTNAYKGETAYEPDTRVYTSPQNVWLEYDIRVPEVSGVQVKAPGVTQAHCVAGASQVPGGYSAYQSFDISAEGYTPGDSASITLGLEEEFDRSRPVLVMDHSSGRVSTQLIDGDTVTFDADHLGLFTVAQAAPRSAGATAAVDKYLRFVTGDMGLKENVPYIVVDSLLGTSYQWMLTTQSGTYTSSAGATYHGLLLEETADANTEHIWYYENGNLRAKTPDGEYLLISYTGNYSGNTTNSLVSVGAYDSATAAQVVLHSAANGYYQIRHPDLENPLYLHRRGGDVNNVATTYTQATASNSLWYFYEVVDSATLSVTPSQNTAAIGSTVWMSAGVTAGTCPVSEYTVTWASEDESIAAVSIDGVVTPLKAGQVYITATLTSVEGNVQSNPITARVLLTVEDVDRLDTKVTATTVLGQQLGKSNAFDPDNLTPGGPYAIVEYFSGWMLTGNQMLTTTQGYNGASGYEGLEMVGQLPLYNGPAWYLDENGLYLNGSKEQYLVYDGTRVTLGALSDTNQVMSLNNTAYGPSNGWNIYYIGAKTGTAANLNFRSGPPCNVASKTGNNSSYWVLCDLIPQRKTVLSVSPIRKTLLKGQTADLSASVTVNGAAATQYVIDWTSSDQAVVSVDSSGKITAATGGNAVITATLRSLEGSIPDAVLSLEIPIQVAAQQDNSVTMTLDAALERVTELEPGRGYVITSCLTGNWVVTNGVKKADKDASYSGLILEHLSTAGGQLWYYEEEVVDGVTKQYLRYGSAQGDYLLCNNRRVGFGPKSDAAFDTITLDESVGGFQIQYSAGARYLHQHGGAAYDAAVPTGQYVTALGSRWYFNRLIPERTLSVQMQADELRLHLGASGTVSYEITVDGVAEGDCQVVWQSSDEEILSVENGLVTGLKPGSAKVTATVSGVQGRKLDTPITLETAVTVEEHSWMEGYCGKPDSCLICGTTRGEPKPHSYGAVITQPTCTEDGYTTYTCALCGDSYVTDAVAAVGHSYSSGVTAPTCTKDGCTTYTCALCGDSYVTDVVAATGHSYVNGRCTACGQADPDYFPVPTLSLEYPSLSFEDEILYNVYYTLDDDANIVEMGLLTFASRQEDGTIFTAQDVVSGFVSSGDTYMVQSRGVPAKNLGDAVYFKVYAKLIDGSYVYSDIAGYHAVLYANTVLNNAGSSAKAKALVVAMLNYGAAAQEYFGYKTDALMNAGLTPQQQALVSAYDESMVREVVKADPSKVGTFVMNGGYSNIFPTVSFEGAFSINFYFAPSQSVDAAPVMYYWDAAAYANLEVLTAENATGVLPTARDGLNWGAAVEGIAAKAIDQTIYVAAVYTVDGVSYPTGVIAYSLGAYCKTVAANGEAFGAATAVYGYYAKAYFA